MLVSLIPGTAVRSTVATTASAAFGAMVPRGMYMFSSTVDCYLAQGEAPVATADDGSVLCPAGATLILDGGHGAKLSVIRATADGACTLTRVRRH